MGSSTRYYEIELQKLLLDFERISLFTKHPTSLGTFRERRLRQYLRDFTPMQLSISTGFVARTDADEVKAFAAQSRQVDCLVFDESKLHPELRTDDYVVVRPEATFAAIEVKSELTFFKEIYKGSKDPKKYPLEFGGTRYRWAGTLVDALRNVKSVKDTCAGGRNPFFGVFGYDSSFDFNTLYHALDNGELQQQLQLRHVDDFPPVICSSRSLIHISPYDFRETSPHHDASLSHFNFMEATQEAPAYPFQFFTNYYLNCITAALNGRPAQPGGLNTGKSAGPVRLWSHHFDLNSEGYEDQ